ncbi:Enoyl-CoA hydratase/isomerase (plasmid) [Pseudonocardia dioxanivorans CB1190]|uniref:Enoyl-CoA hydratase/isomerase n=1 Tax=Pseudonocardia dioxanivorans (strain ATCC 55486 / DSM 44775 / JCM 13855 / CB1190) TaxID=675635 RepID=F2L6H6_PSEUX|nr:enoyl-CoA hydratase/isomerase family protein [Pseudonocardia dioxanivorans]AEA28870.1 Enoyl-CoA hydratase/isomerase [Pseudonocardia dioxanivorans CB1190]
MAEHDGESITTRLQGDVLHLTINRPRARNALRIADKQALTATIAGRASTSRAIVLSGAGEAAFCGGSDLEEMSALDVEQYLEMQYVENALYESIMRSRVPVVAAVHGWALGTGCVLAAACDFVFADTSATFGQPEVLNGAPTPLHGALLPSIIGLNRARWMVLTGRTASAELAQQWGMVHSVTAAGGAAAQTIVFAQDLADSTHPSSMALQKGIVESWIRHPLRRGRKDVHVNRRLRLGAPAVGRGADAWADAAGDRRMMRRCRSDVAAQQRRRSGAAGFHIGGGPCVRADRWLAVRTATVVLGSGPVGLLAALGPRDTGGRNRGQMPVRTRLTDGPRRAGPSRSQVGEGSS